MRPAPSSILALIAFLPALPAHSQTVELQGFQVREVVSGLQEPTALGVGNTGEVYVGEAAAGADRVVTVQPGSGTVTLLAAGIDTPLAIAVPPASRTVYTPGVYVADGGPGGTAATQVVRIDPTTGAITPFYTAQSTESGAYGLAFDRDGRYSNEIFLVDSALPDTIVRLLPDGNPVGSYVSEPNLTSLIVGRSANPLFGFNLLALVNSAGGDPNRVIRRSLSAAPEAVISISDLGLPSRMDAPPAGTCFGDWLYLSDIGGKRLLRVTGNGATEVLEVVLTDMAWLSNETSGLLAFSEDGDSLFVVQDADGTLIEVTIDAEGDFDDDGTPDACDADDDDDGVPDVDDNCPFFENPDQEPVEDCGDPVDVADSDDSDDSSRDAGGRPGTGGRGNDEVPSDAVRINEGCVAANGTRSATVLALWAAAAFFIRRRFRKPIPL